MLDEAGLLMEYNQDLSRAEAEAIIEKNKDNADPIPVMIAPEETEPTEEPEEDEEYEE